MSSPLKTHQHWVNVCFTLCLYFVLLLCSSNKNNETLPFLLCNGVCSVYCLLVGLFLPSPFGEWAVESMIKAMYVWWCAHTNRNRWRPDPCWAVSITAAIESSGIWGKPTASMGSVCEMEDGERRGGIRMPVCVWCVWCVCVDSHFKTIESSWRLEMPGLEPQKLN